MTTNTKRRCAGITRAGSQCKVLVGPHRVYCDKHVPALIRTRDDTIPVIEALHDLGLLKEGERTALVHGRHCQRHTTESSEPCCVGLEVVWADWNQMRVEAIR